MQKKEKKVAVIQSNYIPWKGYFDIICEVDVFVFLDDVQMTKRDWRSRNKIKTSKGTEWLTVPVKGGRHQLIFETEIVQDNWQEKHLRMLQANYSRSPYFKDFTFLLDWLYKEPHNNLSEFNIQTTRMICDFLGVETQLVCSMDLDTNGVKGDRLINICQRVGATTYLSGPTAQNYIDEEKFNDVGIEVAYKDYAGYPEYPQLFPPFENAVSILDMLFNCGQETPYYIWGWRNHTQFGNERSDNILAEETHETKQSV